MYINDTPRGTPITCVTHTLNVAVKLSVELQKNVAGEIATAASPHVIVSDTLANG